MPPPFASSLPHTRLAGSGWGGPGGGGDGGASLVQLVSSSRSAHEDPRPPRPDVTPAQTDRKAVVFASRLARTNLENKAGSGKISRIQFQGYRFQNHPRASHGHTEFFDAPEIPGRLKLLKTVPGLVAWQERSAKSSSDRPSKTMLQQPVARYKLKLYRHSEHRNWLAFSLHFRRPAPVQDDILNAPIVTFGL